MESVQQYTDMRVELLEETRNDSKIFHLILSYPEVNTSFSQYKPGQFVMLRFPDMCGNTLFGRPFSIANISAGCIELYFLAQGKITTKMSYLCVGDNVQVWGPLGNTYSSSAEGKMLIIAGGIGIAPFVGYTQQYCTKNVEFLFGHRIPLESYPYESVAEQCLKSLAYDTDKYPLAGFLEIIHNTMKEYSDGKVLVCGPLPLLRTVQRHAVENSIYTEISVEEQMMCGIGVCLACVCKTTAIYPKEILRNSYVQSCTEGPIFEAQHIIL
ncbi:MAG: FAD-binding oxidoreductase [Desulfovibrionaceae bacterium]